MINFNGTLADTIPNSQLESRGFKYGDALFETIRVVDSKILFWEDHYFRLMASMRVLRMEIPMNFTMEFLEAEILKTISSSNISSPVFKVKIYVERSSNGLYAPETNEISYFITTERLEQVAYCFSKLPYEVDLFKDYFVAPNLLSTLKTNNKALNILASIYAKENNLDNCLLLNTNKQVIEVTNGNLFLVSGNTVKTPPLLDGCLKGIMRKQVIELIQSMDGYEFQEISISPFELQKADALFFTNVISGIQPITKYRKKIYDTEVCSNLLMALNKKVAS
jgi:branched-chain amino acid aminotransferase